MGNEQEIAKLIIRLVAESAEMKRQLQGVTNDLKSHAGQTKGILSDMKSSWLEFTAKAYAAYATLKKVVQWSELGAQAKQTEEAFRNVTRAMGVDGEKLMEQLKERGVVFVEQTELMIKAQRLLAEGMKPDEIVQMMDAARVASRLMGKDVSASFDLISEALITLRTRGLKAAFPMEQDEVFKRYAATLGTVPTYLTEAAKRQAIFNEIVRQFGEKLKLVGGEGKAFLETTDSEKVQRFKSALEETKEMIGKGLLTALMAATDAAQLFLIPIEKTIGLIDWLRSKTLPGYKSQLMDVSELASGHAPAGGTEGLAQGHSSAVIEAKSKEKQITDQYEKDIAKLVLDYRKKTADAVVQITQSQMDIDKVNAIRGAMERGEDTLEIERTYAIRAVNERMKAELAAVAESKKQAESDAKEKGLFGAQAQAAIDKESAAQRTAVVKKAEGDVAKIRLDFATQTKERIAAISKAELDEFLSHKDLLLAENEDLYNRNLITVQQYFDRKRELTLSRGQEELNNLITLRDQEFDLVKKRQLQAQIIQKQNELLKQSVELGAERVRGLDQELQRQQSLARAAGEVQRAELSAARSTLSISKGDELRGLLSIEQRRLDLLQQESRSLDDQRTLNGQLTKEQQDRYSQLTVEIAQVNASVVDLNVRLQEQTGSFFDGVTRGFAEIKDGMATMFQIGRDFAKDLTQNLTSSFGTMLKDFVKTGKVDFQKLADSILDIWLNMLMKMAQAQMTQLFSGGGGGGGFNFMSLFGFGGGSNNFAAGNAIMDSEFAFVPPMFDRGGFTGPGNDPRMAIVHGKEFVQPESAVQYYGLDFMEAIRKKLVPRNFSMGLSFAGGGSVSGDSSPAGGGRGLSIVNIFDPRELDRYMASTSGQNSLLNFMSSRASAIKKILR